MNTVDQLRDALTELSASDADLRRLNTLIDSIESQNEIGAAAVVSMKTIRSIVDQLHLKVGKSCPICHGSHKHSDNCYLHGASGWDLLAEHEATLRENDALRAALARHHPHNSAVIRAGGRHRSLKDRAAVPKDDAE